MMVRVLVGQWGRQNFTAPIDPAVHLNVSRIDCLHWMHCTSKTIRMTLCYAVVLAAVGWYLMVPPLQDGIVKTNAPLSQWSAQGSYYTADECRLDQVNTVEILDQPKSKANGSALRISAGSCIATDDPRLAR
jgi:hypothetical protein